MTGQKEGSSCGMNRTDPRDTVKVNQPLLGDWFLVLYVRYIEGSGGEGSPWGTGTLTASLCGWSPLLRAIKTKIK